MLQKLRICLLAFALGLCCSAAFAKSLVTDRAIFEDPTGQMNLAQIKDSAFAPTPEVVSKGFSRSTFWIRLKLDVPTGIAPLSVRIHPTLLDEATLYYPDIKLNGDELILDMKTRASQQETRLTLQPGPQVIYLRAASVGALLFKVQVLTQGEAIAQDLSAQREMGAVLAAYAFLFFVSAGLILMRREKLALFFIFHLLICLALNLLFFNLMEEMISLTWATGRTASRLITLVNFLSFALLMQSVQGYFGMPRARLVTLFFAGVLSLLVVFFFIGDQHLALRVSTVTGAMSTLALVPTMMYLLYQFSGNKELPLAVRLGNALVVISFIAIVCRIMLHVLGVVEGGEFLLQSPAWRGIFIPLGMAGFLWQRFRVQGKALAQTKIEHSVAKMVAAEKSLRMETQSQFMAMLMHELKTPLYIIQIAAASLSRHTELTNPNTKRLDNIGRAVDDINFIIDRCVQADQLDQSDAPLKKMPVALNALLSDVMYLKESERINLAGTEKAAASAQVFTDYQYTRVILINLVTNALKYSPPDSPVYLSVQPSRVNEAQGLKLKVTNTIGSAGRPDPHKVFTRYYRAEGAKKEVGAGLGLWLAHSIDIKLGTELRCTCEHELVHFEFFLELS